MNPLPASFSPMAIPMSSASCARSVGVWSPASVLCAMVREVEKPNAPARTASAVISRICWMSAWFASSRFSARSPIT